MSTITKEWLQQKIADMEVRRDDPWLGLDEDESNTLAALRIALASLEAEPVAWTDTDELRDVKNGGNGYLFAIGGEANKFADPRRQVMLYTSPPAPVSVPDAYIRDDRERMILNGKPEPRIGYGAGWNACRAAMLQGAENAESLCGIHAAPELNSSPNDGKSPSCISQVIPDRWENCKHLLPIGELIHRLEEQTGDKWISTRDAIPDGYALVPVEPTEDMIVEGFESAPNEDFSDPAVWREYQAMSGCQQAAHRDRLCWAAMIASAPSMEMK